MSAPSRWRHRDHTQGRLLGSLFTLSLPLLVSSLAGGVVFQLTDLAFLSQLGEAPMAAAIIANQSVRQAFLLMVMGASFGAQSLIARAVGEGRREDAEHVAGQIVVLGALLAAFLAVLGLTIPHLLYALPNPDPSFVPYGVPYVRLVFVLAFGVVGMFAFEAILGGAGDTATPMLLRLLHVSIAIFAEWVLIFGNLGAPALGVRGSALGIATGQAVAIAVGLLILFRGGARIHLRRRHLWPDPKVMARITRLSVPPAIQMGGNVIMVFVFLRLVGGFGETAQAGYAVGLRLGVIAPAVAFPLATACATLVGQAVGAGNPRRAWQAVGAGLLVHAPIMLAFAAVFTVFREPIVALFADDPEVVALGADYLQYAAGYFAFLAFYLVFLRSLQGAGDVLVPLGISFASSVFVAVPGAWLLSQHTDMGPHGVWAAQLLSVALVTLATGAWLLTGRWTRRRFTTAA